MRNLIVILILCSLGSFVAAEEKGTLLWSFNGSDRGYSISSIRDVNGDGVSDVLAGFANDTLYCLEGGGSGTTNVIWTFTSGNLNSIVSDVDSMPDVTNDGIPDVVVGFKYGVHVYGLNGANGNIIWQIALPESGGYSNVWIELIGDVNGDSICDIIAGPRENYKLYCISGASKDSAIILWEFPLEGYMWNEYSTASINDIDGDGVREVLVGVGYANSWDKNLVYCISGKGDSAIWIYDVGGGAFDRIDAVNYIEDVNGDGMQDVLAVGGQVYCLDGSNGSLIWNYSNEQSIFSVISIPDINGDGKQEAVACIYDTGGTDKVVCIEGDSDSSGQLLWACPTYSIPGRLDKISDIDSDLIPDIVAGTWNGFVYCISSKTGSVIWEYFGQDTSAYGDVMDITTVKDVNGDSIDDVAAIIYGGPFGGEVWCLSGKVYGVEESDARDNIQDVRLEISPNPFVGTTSIKYKNQNSEIKNFQFQIYDMSGRLIEVTKDNVITNEAGCSIGKDLRAGVYFIKVRDHLSTCKQNKPIKIVKLK